MTKQTINIGNVPNSASGDPLRVAFEKINWNFDELYGNLGGGGSGAGVYVSDTPPVSSSTGTLWFDTSSGRMYIRYDTNWVDASPAGGSSLIIDGGNADSAF